MFKFPAVFLGIQSDLQGSTEICQQGNQLLEQLPTDIDIGDSCKDRKMTGMKVAEYLVGKEGQMEIMEKDKEEQEKFLRWLGVIRRQEVMKTNLK